jgi:hypothetical protein
MNIIERILRMYAASDLTQYRWDEIHITPGMSSWKVRVGRLATDCHPVEFCEPTLDAALKAVESHLLEVLAKNAAAKGEELAAIQEAMRDG